MIRAHAAGRSIGGAVRGMAMAVLVVVVAAFALVAGLSPAHAASRVDISATPAADGSTVVTVSGSGFQYLPNAPGGIYVFFGTVSDPMTNAWAPSQGGRSGSTFSYASTSGSTLLVGFAGGTSAESSNAVIDANGNWSAQMTIPGARFAGSYGDPHSGGAQTGSQIDCLVVQCGIITIGAHGSVNANNESFTPVSFVTADGSVQSGTGVQSFTDEATVLEVPQGADTDDTTTADEQSSNTETAQGALENSSAEGRASGFDTTWIVLGVLAFAVIALIAAIATVLIRRSRTRASVASPALASAAPEGAEAAAPETQKTPELTTANDEGASAR